MQIAGIIGFGLLIFEMGTEALLITLALIVGGLFVYWFYGRIRTTRQYALLHLIERITAKELTTHSLESELKEIIRERDEIVMDRFDDIIEKGSVLDIKQSTKLEDFFMLVADAMSPRLNVRSEELLKLLVEREKQSSTVLSPHLAIPHIILEGRHKFDILIARCREGIFFSEKEPGIQAVFVIMGSKDERNFHLYSLAAIAQIVRDPQFEKKWADAKNKDVLRDIVLLGERRRLPPVQSSPLFT
jgi:APA family basic amino acid/polyamine antiporter